MDDGWEPIDDDELLFRRIPVSMNWYSPESGVRSEAFDPHKVNDITGLSVSRAKYKSPEEAGRGMSGRSYFVAVLRAGDIRAQGMAIEPKPKPDDLGHAELPQLNAENRKTDATLGRQRILAGLCLSVEGPFPSPGFPLAEI